MKPLKLRMQAFGPYARSAEIDFATVSGGGLFLIHGQTGAGKTSLLDGICFSFFGKSSGAERTGESMRCDLAPGDLATEVEFEFALGSERYRVFRKPKQQLAKKRGEGFTTVRPEGSLFRLKAGLSGAAAEDWDLLSSGESKTADAAIGLLGMTEEQFRQVVVLPQGQFRRFLASGSDEREVLLEALFRTRKFRALSERLVEKEKALAAQVGEKRLQSKALLQSLQVDEPSGIEALIGESESRLRELTESDLAVDESYRTISARRDRARLAAQTLTDLAATQAKLSALEPRKTEIDSVTERLESDQRSRPVLLHDQSCLATSRDLEQLAVNISSAKLKAESATSELEALKAEKAALDFRSSEIEKLREDRQTLRQIFEGAKSLKEEAAKALLAESALTRAQVHATSLDEKLLLLRSELQKSHEASSRLKTLIAECEKQKAERSLLATQLSALTAERQSYEALNNEVEILASALTTLAQECRDTERHLLELKLKFHSAQAAILARELKKGEACPVCGSPEHPAPNLGSAKTPTAEELEAAEANSKGRAAAYLRAQTQSASAQERAQSIVRAWSIRFTNGDELVAAEKVGAECDALERALKNRELKIRELEESSASLVAAGNRAEALQSEVGGLEASAKAALAARDAARSVLDATNARIEQLEAQVPDTRRDLDEIARMGKWLKTEIETHEAALASQTEKQLTLSQALAGAHSSLETLRSQAVVKKDELESQERARELALSASGFQTLDACRRAGLPAEVARQLEKTKRLFDDEWAACSSRLVELKLEEERIPLEARDLAGCESEFAKIDRERSVLKGERIATEARLKSLKLTQTRLAKDQKEILELEAKYQVLGKVAGVAAGQPQFNPMRVNFSRYVLQSRLDDVLASASQRLKRMSRDQFILRRAQGAEDKRKNSGLDLEVEDTLSASLRPTSSLSGGEGFMASLALALGLADVVQSRLGGIRLDSVFVDEGFGSLDPESLDEAIKTLADLQAGGRLVGIISHVPELRTQIARRLHVRRSSEGSVASWDT